MNQSAGFRGLKSSIAKWLVGAEEQGRAGQAGSPVSLRHEARNLFGLLNPRLAPGNGLVIQFIGAHRGEGVSSLAREFALVAAQYTEDPVLLLDLAGGRRGQYRHFSLPTVVEALGGVSPALHPRFHTSLLIRGSGREPSAGLEYVTVGDGRLVLGYLDNPDPASVHVGNLPEFWDEVRRKCAFTIIDSPPASRSLEGIILSGSMDAVVIVIAAESTRVHAVQHLCDRLRAQGAPIVGLVLNKRRFYIPERVYRWMVRL